MSGSVDAARLPRSRGFHFGGIPLFARTDLGIWVLVFLFFLGSAILGGGDVPRSLLGALGIIAVMFLVGLSVEVVIETLSDVKGLGTLVGFITNGPEALCLIVGLLVGDLLFAASTPLGSNFMNPVMLVASVLLTGTFLVTMQKHPAYTWGCIAVTASLAVAFFAIPASLHLAWLAVAGVASLVLFAVRPADPGQVEERCISIRRGWLLPAALLLVGAGYLLDPAVSFAADASRAPKGVIGFFVLAALTSWPEFKSCLVLLRRGRPVSAILNITVSNITNLWLAIAGILAHLLLG